MGMAMMGSGVASGEDRAREAAERAVASPLLEDINLAGARGILVNVTAGLDLSIGEFAEVGDTIKAFASDDATVVVGTVLDAELTDEIRVTVVATGLGQELRKPVEEVPVKLVYKEANGGEVNYDNLDRPTVMRGNSVSSSDRYAGQDDSSNNLEYLDVPAFLRRQAD